MSSIFPIEYAAIISKSPIINLVVILIVLWRLRSLFKDLEKIWRSK